MSQETGPLLVFVGRAGLVYYDKAKGGGLILIGCRQGKGNPASFLPGPAPCGWDRLFS